MSRMERYKDVHKKAKPIKEEGIPFRKNITDKETVEDENYESITSGYEEGPREGRLKEEKPPKKPKKRWSLILKIVAGLLAALLIFSLVSFFVGKSAAEHDTSLPKVASETFNGVKSTSGASNILLLGSDSRGEDSGRADTIMVIQVDGPSKKPKIISFMRDTYVEIPGVGLQKINAAYAYGGADLVRETLLNNFGLNCRYYAMVDFQSFEKVIDAMFPSGVRIDAEKDLDLDGVFIKKGDQKMDGHTLLQYARFRMDEEGDFGRVRRQQQVMSAVMSQAKNPLNLLHMPNAAGKIIGYTSTDVPTSFMVRNGLSTIIGAASGIDRLTIPVEDSWYYLDTADAGNVLATDDEMNREAISEFLK